MDLRAISMFTVGLISMLISQISNDFSFVLGALFGIALFIASEHIEAWVNGNYEIVFRRIKKDPEPPEPEESPVQTNE